MPEVTVEIDEDGEKMTELNIEEISKNAVVSEGNPFKIAKLYDKLAKDKKLCFGVIGGSITSGGAATAGNSYSMLVLKWFKEQFPDAVIEYVNAGIGATGSQYAVHRVVRDLLSKNPDFVIIEFSVNDLSNNDKENRCETYESLVRKIMLWNSAPAILGLNMMNQNGENAQDEHNEILNYYDIPALSYKNGVSPLLKSGGIKWGDLSPDSVHPNDTGHFIAAQIIISFLKDAFEKRDIYHESSKEVKEPLTSVGYIDAEILNCVNFKPTNSFGFTTYDDPICLFANGWLGKNGNAYFDAEISAGYIMMMYKKSISGKNAKAKVFVNGTEKCILDGYFKDGWGDYIELHPIVYTKTPQKVNIKIQLLDNDKEFHLLGFLIANKNSDLK